MSDGSEATLPPAGRPLTGVVVLQIGDRRAGRLLSRLLSDQGAAVRVIDPGASDAAALALMAVEECALVVEAAPAGVADAVGLSFDALRAVRPDLVYCSLPVFPPGAAAAPGSVDDDVLVAAEMGLNSVASGSPRMEELPVGSAFAAFLAASAVVAALSRPERQRVAENLVVPLTVATMTTVARRLVRADDPTLADPVAGPRLPIAARYECADGRFIQSGGAYPRFVSTLVNLTGHPEWNDAAQAALVALPAAQDEAMWHRRLADVFRKCDAAEWERIINAAGGSCTMCRTREEWAREPHALASGMVTWHEGVPRAGSAVRVFEPPLPSDAQVADTARNGFAADGPPLDGVTVVDVSIVLAGPTCGRTLADLGAAVIKVDDPLRPISPYGWLEVNRGKRSILLDLRQQSGQQVLWRLLADADVLVENYRRGKLDQLGFGFDAVARARPGIVYASLNAFDVGGPWEARAGWEHNAQAATGMQLALPGWGPGRPPDQVTYPLNDFGTGLLGAYGIALALRERARTGAAQFVVGSLARTSTFIQSPLLESTAEAPSATAIQWIACADGYLGVVPGSEFDPATAPELRVSTRAAAAEQLRSRGVSCVEVRGSAELANRPWVRDSGLIVDWDHPRWGGLHQARVRSWSSRFAAPDSHPAHDPGQDAHALLAEYGFGEAEIAALFESGAVAAARLFEMWSLT